ncbi:phenylalanyl-tRNA synthetase beta chain [Liquorilactobacillus sucicola DSM 21376 = JCM 15457]|uniref:Phenylalanine--tRNA ligase beta subunit n=1 Tax=Liquorilactobacillus sucicola DSM 21376 = JCM 15457 TaxID=1423806 RepID=A0A023CUA5_9LACO|nr:phenylalanine--tRNA ligase subunit beta [Liquorilactobacillus sucicola]KRN05313.1 phenylalanyl-tRNA synthetase subunit beta [Liquorilactobacillus sucicola DSM 21376 = JCM 15457]GAJ25379.1 phenylalanyl-tRNA synthetase beta chain [Liquorilactobacillus sucicola DSM 21376 = JCM 15457]
MKISTKWLSDYVNVDVEPQVLAEKIERTAVEVDEVYRLEDGLKKIVVGETLKVAAHPNSDHLHICQVDVGEDEPLQIICGAPNIAAHKKVIVALPNSRIAGNVKIKRGKMRGEVSEGMICALQEIGFTEGVVPKKFVDGIYFLPDNAEPGKPVYPYLGMDEDIIDLDVTPNRADMLSMRGTAYEIAAIYNKKVSLPHLEVKESTKDNVADYLKLKADTELASTYLMRLIKNVTVKESPLWLQKRLWNAGVRPLNNIVDVTNYVLMDYGQPLHSFDYGKINGNNITVRLAKAGEILTTLDEQERELDEHDIVIADDKGPIALAGTMGGQSTEIDGGTTTVALEAAVFNSSLIRKTARRHNLHSEASMRFERGVNRATVAEALNTAAQLIADLGEGEIVSGVAEGSLEATTPVEVSISLDKINKVLGTDLTIDIVADIFKRLEFGVEINKNVFTVSVPPRRWDISIPADLIEEVARIYGYDNLPATLPKGELTPGHYNYTQKIIRETRQLLEAAGLTQAVSYGLTTTAKAQRFLMQPSEATQLSFPMSSDRTTARMNLISGLLDDIAYNVARKVKNIAFYEQGRVFYREKGTERPVEVEHVAGALTGLFETATWHNTKTPVDFYLTKGIVEHLLHTLGVTENIRYVQANGHEEMHPGRTADVYVGNEFLGFLGEIHPNIAKEYHIERTYIFELDLKKIITMPKQLEIYTPISKYPAITRDVALAVNKSIQNSEIVSCIRKNGGKNLAKVELFDVYEGEHIAVNFKSLAYKLTYQNKKTTLLDEDVSKDFAKVVAELKKEFDAEIR